MNPRQKVLFSQLQIAGLGIVVAIFAWLTDTPVFYYIGAGIFLFGFVRFCMFRILTDHDSMEDSSLSAMTSLDPIHSVLDSVTTRPAVDEESADQEEKADKKEEDLPVSDSVRKKQQNDLF